MNGYLNSQEVKARRNKASGDKRPSRGAEAEEEPNTKGLRKEGISRTASEVGTGNQGRCDAQYSEDLEASFHSTRSGSSVDTKPISPSPRNPGNQQQQQNSARTVEAQSLDAGLARLIPKMAGTNGAKNKKKATDLKKATVPTGKKRTKDSRRRGGAQTDDDEGTKGRPSRENRMPEGRIGSPDIQRRGAIRVPETLDNEGGSPGSDGERREASLHFSRERGGDQLSVDG